MFKGIFITYKNGFYDFLCGFIYGIYNGNAMENFVANANERIDEKPSGNDAECDGNDEKHNQNEKLASVAKQLFRGKKEKSCVDDI